MSKKKIYAVDLITTSIQTKLVQAENMDQALEIASDSDWMEKEEVTNSKTKSRLAVLKGDEKKGKLHDFYESDYILTENGDFKRYSELLT